jgi:hypothetical protein
MCARERDPSDALYEAPLSEFVATRNALAARLTKTGDTAQAKAIKAIAKPKATIWAINRVARRAPKAVQQVMTAFDRLKTTQLRDPSKVGDASDALRAALEAVAHQAIEALQGAGIATTLDTHRRITNTLRGAAATQRGALGAGSLTDEVTPGGFELFGTAMPKGRKLHVVRDEPPERAAAKRDDLARRRAEQLETEAGDRERAARKAAASALEARQRLRELEEQARAATRDAAKSRRLAQRARGRAERG